MRFILSVGLALLILTEAPAAERPIPHDAARMEKQFRQRLEWNRRTLQEAYGKVGKKDPRWDKPAREALDLAARMFSRQFDPIIRPADIHIPAKKAVDAGCDDPLIRYLYARTSIGPFSPGDEEHDRRLRAAADAMSASTYSPLRRAVAMRHSIERKIRKPNPNAQDRRDWGQELDALVELLPRSIAEDPRNEFWEDAWYDQLGVIIAAYGRLSGDYKAAQDRVDVRLARIPGIEALRSTLRGNCLISRGWEARTSELAANVSAEQFRTFQARLREARATLMKVWEARPDEPNVARLMMLVELGIGGGNRDAMETWFERAMQADGNDQRACLIKLDWLDPKWYGSDTFQEAIAFGRSCAATKNWHNGITLLVADAHFRHWSRLPNEERQEYMRSPEVWSEIKSVYGVYQEHYPDDNVQQSKYAMISYVGAHYPEAHDQFQAVGKYLTIWKDDPRMTLETLKKARDHTATIIARRDRGVDPVRKGAGHGK